MNKSELASPANPPCSKPSTPPPAPPLAYNFSNDKCKNTQLDPEPGDIWRTRSPIEIWDTQILHITGNNIFYRTEFSLEIHHLPRELFIKLYRPHHIFPDAPPWHRPANFSFKTFWQWLQRFFSARQKN